MHFVHNRRSAFVLGSIAVLVGALLLFLSKPSRFSLIVPSYAAPDVAEQLSLLVKPVATSFITAPQLLQVVEKEFPALATLKKQQLLDGTVRISVTLKKPLLVAQVLEDRSKDFIVTQDGLFVPRTLYTERYLKKVPYCFVTQALNAREKELFAAWAQAGAHTTMPEATCIWHDHTTVYLQFHKKPLALLVTHKTVLDEACARNVRALQEKIEKKEASLPRKKRPEGWVIDNRFAGYVFVRPREKGEWYETGESAVHCDRD